jgi:hypothetical protein
MSEGTIIELGPVGDGAQDANRKMAENLRLTSDISPDAAAHNQQLATETGMPLDFISRNAKAAAALADQLKVTGLDLSKTSPKLAEYFDSLPAVAVSKDDVDALRDIERISQAPITPWARFKMNIEDGHYQIKSSLQSSIKMFADMAVNAQKEWEKAMPEEDRKAIAKKNETPDLRVFKKLFEGLTIDPAIFEEISSKAAAKAEEYGQFKWDLPHRGGIKGLYDDVVKLAPQIASQISAAMLFGPGGSMSFMGAQIAGAKYKELEDAGVDQYSSVKAALADAFMQAPLEQLGLSRALAVWKPGKTLSSVAKRLLDATGTEFITEWLQAYPDAVTEIWGLAQKDGKDLSEQFDIFVSRIADITMQGMYEGLVAAPFGFALGGVNIAVSGEPLLLDTKELIEKEKTILDAVSKSKTAKRGAIHKFLNILTPEDTMFISSDGVINLFQTVGEEAAKELLGRVGVNYEMVKINVEHGLDTEVKKALFRSGITPEEFGIIQNDIKASPSAPTIREASFAKENTKKRLRERAEEDKTRSELMSKELARIRQEGIEAGYDAKYMDYHTELLKRGYNRLEATEGLDAVERLSRIKIIKDEDAQREEDIDLQELMQTEGIERMNMPVTLKVLAAPELKNKAGKMVKLETINQILNQKKTKKIEKEIINDILSREEFKGLDSFSFDAFKAAVEGSLMQLQQLHTGAWADYGKDNTGFGPADVDSVVYNSPVNHGYAKHFKDLFGVYESEWREPVEYEIVEVPQRPGVFVAMDVNRPDNLTAEELEEYVGTVGSREAVERWIEEYEKHDPSELTIGEFGHVRRWDRNSDRFLPEVQGDFFQSKDVEDEFALISLKNPQTYEQSRLADKYEALQQKEKAFSDRVRKAFEKVVSAFAKIKYDKAALKRNEKEKAESEKRLKVLRDEFMESVEVKEYTVETLPGDYFGFLPDGHTVEDRLAHLNENLKAGDAKKTKDSVVRSITQDGVWLATNWQQDFDLETWAEKHLEDSSSSSTYRAVLSAIEYNKERIKDLKEEIFLQEQLIEILPKGAGLTEYEAYYNNDIAIKNVLKEVKENFTLLQRQFIAHKKNFPERLLREEIRQAARSGIENIFTPTPRTSAFVEQFINYKEEGFSGGMYEVTTGNPEGPLEIGDRIEYGGVDYVVVEVSDDDIEVIPYDDMNYANLHDGVAEERYEMLYSVMSELPDTTSINTLLGPRIEREGVQMRLPGFEYLDIKPELLDYYGDGQYLAGDDLVEIVRAYVEDYVYLEEGEDAETVLVDKKEIESMVEDHLNKVFPDYVMYEWEQSKYDNFYVVEEGNHILFSDMEPETFPQPHNIAEEEAQAGDLNLPVGEESWMPVEEERPFDLDQLSDLHKGIVLKYKALSKILRSIKPDSFTIVRDKKGFEWYRVKINPSDAGPVTLYQKDSAPDVAFNQWFRQSKTVDADGNPLILYSGHFNVELYGDAYSRKLSTAGGFYASEDPAIGSGYAVNKLGSREYYEQGDQYRFKLKNGKWKKKLWQVKFTKQQQKKIKKMLLEEGYDLEKYWKQNKPFDADASRALARGGLEDAFSVWQFLEFMGLNIAYNDTYDPDNPKPITELQNNSMFEDILDELGIEWQSYQKAQPGVMPVYLSIQNPIDASQPFPEALLKDLKKAASRERSKRGADDQWSKHMTLREWVEIIESGSEYWPTQIPLKAIPIMQRHGFDGIKERGMKGVEDETQRQINWIAFEPTQIKSVYNKGTFSTTDPNILNQAVSGFTTTDARTFVEARNKTGFRDHLTFYTEEELEDAELYIIPGFNAGYGLRGDEIINVFNNSGVPGLGALALIDAITRGGKRLDHYEGFLSEFYSALGFVEVKREKEGNRTVIFSEYKGETNDPRIVAGMYEAAWNKRLGRDGITKTVLEEIYEQFDSKERQRLADSKQELFGRSTKNYLERNWLTYQEGVNDTLVEAGINPVKNVLVKSKPDAANKRLLLQVTSNSIREEASDAGEAYYNAIYNNRDGYARAVDFWEIPQWAAEAKHLFPESDLYVVRNMEEAKAFLRLAEYDSVMISVMDSNKHFVKRILEGYEGRVQLGGYIDPTYFKYQDNITFFNSLAEAAKAEGVEYKRGADYSLFKGTKTIPRLELSQGCLHNCAFCTVPNKIELAPASFIDQQVEAFKDLDFELIYLNDKTFGQADNYKYLTAINKKLKKQNKNFKGFIIQTTAPALLRMSDEFLEESGIKFVELGMESYNDDVLQKIKKPHNKDLLDKAADKIRKHNMYFIPNVMVGLAGRGWTETAETYQNTLDFLEKHKDIISHSNIYVLALYEGTELNSQLNANEEIDSDENVLDKTWLRGNIDVHDAFYEKALNFNLKQLGIEVNEAKVNTVRKSTEPTTLNQEISTSPWYSVMESVLADKLPGKASPKQYIDIINSWIKKGVIKKEEVDWADLIPWLRDQDEWYDKITKEELMLYVISHSLKLEEKIYMQESPKNQRQIYADNYNDAIRRLLEADQPVNIERLMEDYENMVDEEYHGLAEIAIENWQAQEALADTETAYTRDDTQHSEYQMEGDKKDYIELVLYYPKSPYKDHDSIANELYGGRNYYDLNGGEQSVVDKQVRKREDFKSHAFEEPNIVVWVRGSVRTDAEGKTVFVIEEIQTDWHQRGRKRGYKGVLPEGYTVAKDDEVSDMWQVRNKNGNVVSRAETKEEAVYFAASSDAVPDAPFKKTWPLLAMKRIIRYAAEKGYDKVAWTPGIVQAKRWEQVKYVDEIDWFKNEDGTYLLDLLYSGIPQQHEQNVSPEMMKDLIGNEYADMILKDENTRDMTVGELAKLSVEEQETIIEDYRQNKIPKVFSAQGNIKTPGLTIGGEFFKNLYDRTLPNQVNKMFNTKKWGNAKVETTRVALPGDRVEIWGKYNDDDREMAFQKDYPNMQVALAEKKLWEAESPNMTFEIRHEGRQELHSLTITPEMKEKALSEGLPLFQDKRGLRGQLQITDDKYLIRLFDKKNLSTLVHETGHIFLYEIKQLIDSGQASEALLKDWKTLHSWLGLNESDPLTREAHEKFADAFVQYLWEGNAPTRDLRDMFQRFKDWLLSVYKTLKDFGGVELTDEVRDVFNRLLSTQQAVMQAAEANDIRSLTTAEYNALGVLPEDRKYMDYLLRTAFKRAEQNMNSDRDRSRRKLTKKWRKDAIAELREDPVYSMIDELSRGKGIDRSELIAYYGEDIIERLPKRVPPIVAPVGSANTMALDEAAVLYGYGDADEMVRDLINAQPKTLVIESMIAQQQRVHDDMFKVEDYLLTTQEYADYLMIKNRYELTAEGKPTEVAPVKAFRDEAKRQLANRPVKDAIRHDLFLGAMRRFMAEEKKHIMKGDMLQASEASEVVRLNYEYASQATKNRKEIEKLERLAKRLKKRKKEIYETSYRDAIYDLLNRFGLVKEPLKLEERSILAALVEGSETITPFAVSDTLLYDAKKYKDILMREAEELRDLLLYLDKHGKKERSDRFGRDIKGMAAMMAEESEGLKKKKVLPKLTALRKYSDKFRSFISNFDSINFVMIAMGGYKSIQKPGSFSLCEVEVNQALAKAADKRHVMLRETYEKLWPHYMHILKSIKAMKKKHGSKITQGVPEVPGVLQRDGQVGWWTPSQIFALALNVGNESNKTRIFDGFEGFTEADLNKLLGFLSKADWDAIQAVWDLNDELFVEINKVHRRMNGFTIEKIPAVEVKTKYGTYRGGYAPVRYDSKLAERVGSIKEQNIATLHEKTDLMARNDSKFMVPAAKTSAIMKRVSRTPYSLLLSLEPISDHIIDTVHYITHAEVIRDIDRYLKTDEMKTAVVNHLGSDVYSDMRAKLAYIASPRKVSSDPQMDGIAGWLRQRTTPWILAYNHTVAAKQGFSSPAAALSLGKARWLASYIEAAFNVPDIKRKYSFMMESSPYMQGRMNSFDQEFKKQFKLLGPDEKMIIFGDKTIVWEDVVSIGFLPIQAVDLATVLPLWHGAYRQKMKDLGGNTPEDHEAAVTYADELIRTTQPSAQAMDLTGAQRKSGLWTLLSMFGTYTIGKYQQRVRLYWRGMRSGKISKTKYAEHFMLEQLLPAIAMNILVAALKSRDFDDDETWERIFFDAIGQLVSLPLPLIGNILYPFANYGFEISPIQSLFDAFQKPLLKAGKAARENDFEELAKQSFWTIATAASIAKRVPVTKVIEKVDRAIED